MMMLANVVLALVAAAGSTQSRIDAVDCDNCVEWNKAIKPFNVYGNICYVGVEGLSVVLLTSPEGRVLLDALQAAVDPVESFAIGSFQEVDRRQSYRPAFK